MCDVGQHLYNVNVRVCACMCVCVCLRVTAMWYFVSEYIPFLIVQFVGILNLLCGSFCVAVNILSIVCYS